MTESTPILYQIIPVFNTTPFLFKVISVCKEEPYDGSQPSQHLHLSIKYIPNTFHINNDMTVR